MEGSGYVHDPVPAEWEVGWMSERVWTFRRREGRVCRESKVGLPSRSESTIHAVTNLDKDGDDNNDVMI